jgi:hypothetical protein
MLKNTIQGLVTVILIMGMVVPPTGSARELAGVVEALPSSSGLYRTRVAVRQPADWSRLERLGVTVLEQGDDWALVLADEAQLETLARLRFEPQSTDELGMLVTAHAQAKPWLAAVLATLTPSPSPYQGEGRPKAGVRVSLTLEQKAGLSALSSVDDDGDGLTNTEEQWWCTDKDNPDSDGDLVDDGTEVDQLRTGNIINGAPFEDWPPYDGCPDGDNDSVPDAAEDVVGLDRNRNSTDGDAYNDALEFFGLDRTGENLPNTVRDPGRSPFVAAYPEINVEVVGSSIQVKLVSEVMVGEAYTVGTDWTYGIERTQGSSLSVGQTEGHTISEWQEVGNRTADEYYEENWTDSLSSSYGQTFRGYSEGQDEIRHTGRYNETDRSSGWDVDGEINANLSEDLSSVVAGCLLGLGLEGCLAGLIAGGQVEVGGSLSGSYHRSTDNTEGEFESVLSQSFDEAFGHDLSGWALDVREGNRTAWRRLQETSVNHGVGYERSWATTITKSQYEEVTQSQAQTERTEQEWSTATSTKTDHAADLYFTFNLYNSGTDTAHNVRNIQFNIFLGGDPDPISAYASIREGEDCRSVEIGTFAPLDYLEAGNCPIPLTLDQLRILDLGAPVRIVVANYDYDEEDDVNNAWAGGVLVEIDDGRGNWDGVTPDESVDTYLVPTFNTDMWGDETYQDVIRRYLLTFGVSEDVEGNLIGLRTPEYNSDRYIDSAYWHLVDEHHWWDILLSKAYTDTLTSFKEERAMPRARVVLRYNQDDDGDSYTNRIEHHLGTDPTDAYKHPSPLLVAGYTKHVSGAEVELRMAFQNLGNFPASGAEAVLVAPNGTISVTNNLVGGAGLVHPGEHIVLGGTFSLTVPAGWIGTSQPRLRGSYTGNVDGKVYTFTANGSGEVGSPGLSLSWDDGTGHSGSLNIGSVYQTPTYLPVAEGLEIALGSGTVVNGQSFTVIAHLAGDTFKYTIESEPYTEPIIVISYNDPQGNHKLVTPVELPDLDTDLKPYKDEMQPYDPELHITSLQSLVPGQDIPLHFVYNNPTDQTLEDVALVTWYAHADSDGTIVAADILSGTLLSGPNIFTMMLNTDVFSPTFSSAIEYKMVSMLLDRQDTILDEDVRYLSDLRPDPRPTFAMADTDATWDFGTVTQGEILEHTFTLASIGFMDLLTYLSSPGDLSVTGAKSRKLAPGDTTTYAVTLDTRDLPTGLYDETITIRTSDPDNPTRTVHVTGNIQPLTDAALSCRMVYRPWDRYVWIPGDHDQNEQIEFPHLIDTDPAEVEPLYVYDEGRGTLLGSGEVLPAGLTGGTLSTTVFGDGSDGDLTVSSGQTKYVDNVRTQMTSTANAGQKNVSVASTSGFPVGDEVLVIQMQGTGAGNYEFGTIASIGSGGLTLQDDLQHTYTVGGNSKAQVLRVPHYCNVTVQGVLTAHGWNGTTGGIVAFRAEESLNVLGGGQITVKSLGYRGGNHSSTQQVQGEQGESSLGLGTRQVSVYLPADPDNRNGAGGGGGAGDDATPDLDAGGGGGGGHGSNGENGYRDYTRYNGQGGQAIGDPGLSQMYFGGGGGSGGNDNNDTQSGDGGRGGGIIIAYGRAITVTGQIIADGANGGNSNSASGSGGGGAGGTIWLIGKDIDVGTNRVLAQGGQGGDTGDSWRAGHGGNGGFGRIRIEYSTLSGTTDPSASTRQVSFFAMEKVDADTVRYILPESFTGGRTYWMQFGQQGIYSFDNSRHAYNVRLPKRSYSSVTFDVIVGGGHARNKFFGEYFPNRDLSGSPSFNRFDDRINYDWGSGSPQIAFPSDNFSVRWWGWIRFDTGRYRFTTQVDDGVRLWLDGELVIDEWHDVTAPASYSVERDLIAGAHDIYIEYYEATGTAVAKLTWDRISTSISPYNIAVDIGNDGSTDWSVSDSTAPTVLHSSNLASAFNDYLSTAVPDPDETVVVPIAVTFDNTGVLFLTNLAATPASDVDVTLDSGDIDFGEPVAFSASLANGTPTEGQLVPVQATLHNSGTANSGPLTVAFFATPPDGFGETYIGSDFVPNVSAGLTITATIQWNTLGFTGDVPVRVKADPYDRVAETDEDNNEATASLTILTRPDLHVTIIELSDPEPVAGQPVTVTLTISNAGQTDAGTSALALYDGNPESGGTLVCERTAALAGENETALECTWTPTQPGSHRLFTISDRDDAVNEFDEGNNHSWEDVYVGFAGPILLDSGTAGDVDYTAERGYGYVDEGAADALENCGSEPHQTYRRDPSNRVVYRFDHLLPGHFYHLDVTLFNCPAQPRRLETVLVDDIAVAGPIDLKDDGEVHYSSTLLDPALYANRTISVTIQSSGSGAVVSEVNLHDIDYRYVDAGGDNDLGYTAERGYGYLDEGSTDQTNYGTLPYQSYREDQGDTELRYQFDGLDPAKRYLIHLTFYQASPFTITQQVAIDSVDTGLIVEVGPGQIFTPTVSVPLGTYQGDGRIVVRVIRPEAGAFVNEIALEELTQGTLEETQTINLHIGWNWFSFALEPKIDRETTCTGVTPTSAFSSFTGNVRIDEQPAPVGTLVEAYSPRGDKVGCVSVATVGVYPFMRVYGEEAPLPGMRAGEPVIFKVNGVPATITSGSSIWQNDRDTHTVNLAASSLAPVEKVLKGDVEGKYTKLLCPEGTYRPPPANPIFNSCHTMQPGLGYLIYMTEPATLIIRGTRVPADTPLGLKQGWNWIGYLPECSLAIETALTSIDGRFDLLHGEDGTYQPPPENPANNLHQVGPGCGYMIRMTEAATLTYPASACGVALTQTSEVSETSEVWTCDAIPTPYFTSFYGTVMLGNRPYPAGAWIEALSPRGEVVGCSQIVEEGVYPFLRVYGADEDMDIPGMQAGEPVAFWVNGRMVELGNPPYWQNDRDVHELDLRVEPIWVYLPLVWR